MRTKIVHLIILDKFIPSFIEFFQRNFSTDYHIFLITNSIAGFSLPVKANIIFLSSFTSKLKKYIFLTMMLNRSNKIILHGLFDIRVQRILFLQPWLLKKCYWIIWGGDLYNIGKNHKIQSILQDIMIRRIIKYIKGIITYIRGDYELVRKKYNAKGKYIECLMYPSNLFYSNSLSSVKVGETSVLIGNSADPSNYHFEIFTKLQSYNTENIKIYCPLSYGDMQYAKEVSLFGKKLFGDRFTALSEFIAYEDYLKILSSIDVAIFNNKRQQAMGNIINLLGFGKKVYLRSDTTPWRFFMELGIMIYDSTGYISLESLDEDVSQKNIEMVKKYFSKETLALQWKSIIED